MIWFFGRYYSTDFWYFRVGFGSRNPFVAIGFGHSLDTRFTIESIPAVAIFAITVKYTACS